jgi:tripartite-type tricarboxylate transporter receptor subunit TctC
MSDNLARVIANALTQQMGQTFIIDNKPGAGTTIAADNVAKSVPDGHTLFMQDLTSHAISASLYKKLPFDPVKDFTTITLVASTPLVMVVNPAANIGSVKELIDIAKANPGKLNYGSSGIGSILHLSGELFKQRAGIDLLHVPYKGATGSTAAMMGGEINVTFSTMPTAVPLVKSGRIKAIAVTTAKRSGAMPDVPTMQQAGIHEYDVVLYNGFLAPAGLPADITAKLRNEIFKALQTPEVKAFYATVSADLITSTSEEMTAQIVSDIKKYSQAVRDSGAKAD